MLLPAAGSRRANSAPGRLAPRQRVILSACALITAVAAAWLSPPHAGDPPEEIGTFRPPVKAVPPSETFATFHESWVTPPGHTASAHSSALCVLPSGDLL